MVEEMIKEGLGDPGMAAGREMEELVAREVVVDLVKEADREGQADQVVMVASQVQTASHRTTLPQP